MKIETIEQALSYGFTKGWAKASEKATGDLNGIVLEDEVVKAFLADVKDGE
jgi:hypothetical protein